jgi:hypothetical protein
MSDGALALANASNDDVSVGTGACNVTAFGGRGGGAYMFHDL